MRQVMPDSTSDDGRLGFIPAHPRPQSVDLQAQEGPQSQE